MSSFIVHFVVAVGLVSEWPATATTPQLAAKAQAPTVFAPGVISGPAWDSAPAFAPDGQTIYFSRANTAVSTVMVSHRGKGNWSPPEIAPFSGTWSDMEPAMSPDGRFMVFVSNRPTRGTGKPLDGLFNGRVMVGQGGNLWRVDRKGDTWGTPVHLPAVVNRSTSIFAPCVVRDGSLYFMDPTGDQGKFRLYRSQLKDGAYQTAQAVAFSAGTGPWSDVDPAVAPDESYAVFASGRPPAQGMNLFLVCRKNNTWGQPVHMGTQVNSSGSDAEARFSPDGKTLYFASDRVTAVHFPRTLSAASNDLKRLQEWDNGNYNIWQLSLVGWLREECGR